MISLKRAAHPKATLLGREEMTVESLYLSPRLADELETQPATHRRRRDDLKDSLSKTLK